MRSVYMDNAATSFPKAPGVVDAMVEYMTKIGANVGRGAYESSYAAENIVYETRAQLAELFDAPSPDHVIFTKNITEGLNILIKGLLKPGDHVLTSSVEHNAVMRPLTSMGKCGVQFERVPCSNKGDIDCEALKQMITPKTKAVIMTHGSNVCGTVLDLKTVGQICKEHNLIFIIDSAQTAGVIRCSLKELGADAIAFTGHKGLLGPQGMGGFVITEALVKEIPPFIEGGTGSYSDSEEQPERLPDKYEAGTINIPGIYGLNASLKYLMQVGIESVHKKEMDLTAVFLKGVEDIEHVRVIGYENMEKRLAVVSLDFTNEDNGLVAHHLETQYGVKVRCGLHCAPSAHKTLNTFPQGTVRFSFGSFNTFAEIEYIVEAIKRCKNI